MKSARFIIAAALVLSMSAPLRAFYCSQIPADCGCPAIGYGHFLSCGPHDSMLSCYGTGIVIVLGKMLAHPQDTGRLVYNVNGGIGKFVIEDVIASKPGNAPLSPGDTLEAASGGSCYSWYRPDSVTRVVALYRQVDSRDTDVTCYYIPGCMNSILSYENGRVIGVIDYPGIDTMPYADFKQLIAAKTGTISRGKFTTAPNRNRKISARRAGNHLIVTCDIQLEPGDNLSLWNIDGRLVVHETIGNVRGKEFVVPLHHRISAGVFITGYGPSSQLLIVK